MLRLHIVQADYGDCLILAYGSATSPHHMLIDGGPHHVYENHLQPVLDGLDDAQTVLDHVVLSHIDEDHVVGLLDLLKALQWQRARGRPEPVAIGALWHNSFSRLLGEDVERRFDRLMGTAAPVRGLMPLTDRTGRSVGQGHKLTEAAESLAIVINPEFTPSHFASLDEAPEALHLENVHLRLIGPGETRLEKLRGIWFDWLEEQRKKLSVPDRAAAERAAADADDSVPNLSSIMFLVKADDKSMLFTGDGLYSDILEGLEEAGLLDDKQSIHLDVLKVPHHGSNRNVSPGFFEKVTADCYVISANDRTNQDNPDYDTLQWIVEASQRQGRPIEILVTNLTKNTRKLMDTYDPGTYGYRLTLIPEGDHVITLELAP
jgi:glyoxylase-like metal-dependent hydrolase (beta-lactamase superfamily II)